MKYFYNTLNLPGTPTQPYIILISNLSVSVIHSDEPIISVVNRSGLWNLTKIPSYSTRTHSDIILFKLFWHAASRNCSINQKKSRLKTWKQKLSFVYVMVLKKDPHIIKRQYRLHLVRSITITGKYLWKSIFSMPENASFQG